jgi:hypothetical protein
MRWVYVTQDDEINLPFESSVTWNETIYTIIMISPPISGKPMLQKQLPTILI